MTIVTYKQCDIDRNEICNTEDYNIFIKFMGQCINGNYYNDLADVNHDGCITYEDQQILFPNSAK